MAFNISDYLNSEPPNANYPQGSFKNETVAGLKDGTPYEKSWPNDVFGFLQKLLLEANVVPSGSPDTVLASDYFDAMVKLFFNKPYRKTSATGNLLVTDGIVYADATAGDIVLTSPSPAALASGGSATEITIKRIDTSPFKVTVAGITGEDGGAVDLTGTGRVAISISSDGIKTYVTSGAY